MKYINELSYLSAPIRKRLSPFASYLLRNKLITKSDSILDYGCGYGTDAEFLRRKGFSVDCYDPYYFPDFPTKQYSVVLCSYVLDVLTEDSGSVALRDANRLEVIRKAWSLCSGRFYLTAGKISKIYLRAILNIGTQKLSQKLVNRIFCVSHKAPTIKTYSQEEAITAIENIRQSGWVAPNSVFIDEFVMGQETKYKYTRLKSYRPFLNPFSGSLIKTLYIKPSNADFIINGVKRRDFIKSIQFHTYPLLFLHLFRGDSKLSFLK